MRAASPIPAHAAPGPSSSSGDPTPRQRRRPSGGAGAAGAAARRRLRGGVLAVVAVDRMQHLARLFTPLPPAAWQLRAAAAAAAAAAEAAEAEAEARAPPLAKLGRSVSAPVITGRSSPPKSGAGVREATPPPMKTPPGPFPRWNSLAAASPRAAAPAERGRGEDDDELLAALASCECSLG